MQENSDYKKLLDRREPLDKLILELVNKGELDIGFVEVNDSKDHQLKKYSRNSIPHRGKHTS